MIHSFIHSFIGMGRKKAKERKENKHLSVGIKSMICCCVWLIAIPMGRRKVCVCIDFLRFSDTILSYLLGGLIFLSFFLQYNCLVRS